MLPERPSLILPILLKAGSAVRKEFLKAAGSHMDGFPKAAGAGNFRRFLNIFCIGFGNLFMQLLAAF
jgi:hypothetical protein